MASLQEVPFDPFNASPMDLALSAEGVDGKLADIARSIYMQESGGGKNTTTSNAGAVGGMQVIPSTFAQVADKGWSISDPVHNARAGVRYVKQLYEQAGGDPALTAAGYYGGPGGLEKARRGVAVSDPRNPKAPTTLQYGQQVAARLPKEKGLIQRGVEAMTPSAHAETKGPRLEEVDFDPFAVSAGKEPPKSTPAPGILRSLPFGLGLAVNAMQGGFMKDEAAKAATGVASGTADVGNTLINAGVKATGAGADWNAERQAGLKAFNADSAGPAFNVGRVAGNIGATYPIIGGAIGQGVKALGANALGTSIGSAGFSTGLAPASALGQAGNMGLRMLGGGITGGLSAGAINPAEATTGAAIGALAPPIVSGAGKLGGALGNSLATRAAAQSAEMGRKAPATDTLRESLAAGYVVPPSSVKPSFSNTVKESIGGKIATAQTASSKNQLVTDKLVRQALGIADDAPLSAEVLSKYRAGQHAAGYEPLRAIGAVKADKQFADDLGSIAKQYTGKGTIPAIQKTEISNLVAAHKSSGFDAGDAVDAIRILRDDADDAFRKGDSALGKANRGIANAYESALDRSLPPGSDMLKAYRDARANIAKSFTVRDALREGAGTVDARKLAAALQKGKPLSGELLAVAKFGNVFPKAAQPPELVAGPGVHNMRAGFSGAGGIGGALLGGPLGSVIGAAVPWIVPPAVRMQMFSKGAQQALLPQASNFGAAQQFSGLLTDPVLQQSLLRMAPVVRPSLLNVD